jgi:GTP pyrophosphokinase
MVSVVHAIPSAGIDETSFAAICAGLTDEGRDKLTAALELAVDRYGERTLGTGESVLRHAMGMTLIVASLNLDTEARLAALLFAIGDGWDKADEYITAQFGPAVAALVRGLQRLNGLRLLTRDRSGTPQEIKAQTEVLRKMLLAMVEDVRVVLLRLASRTQTLRHYTDKPGLPREETARESLEIYAPLANRLGVWQLKWELEDLSFRFTEPETYKRIAKMLDERRLEREDFITGAIDRLQREMNALGIKAEVYGRPKHIYSIWNKMRGKNIDFSEVYDVRALRVIVDEIKDCYTALGMVHQLWQPVTKEFDDYISNPKGNDYRSLHTAVIADDGRALEVQIRTRDMHRHAELGVAAHWRYKEAGSQRADSSYDDKIAWLRQLLSWRDEITDSEEWVEQFKRASLDDTIYVVTPQGRVIDLAKGSTALDFAYRLHTDLGHRCRGARVDGHLVPLNTPLANGQRVEIVAAKSGGPSRDWLNPTQGYLATSRAKHKVKQWFSAQEEAELLTQGRAVVGKELQREGQTQANIEELAQKLGFKNGDALYTAAARGEVGQRQMQVALRGEAPVQEEPEIQTRRSKVAGNDSQVLVVGVGKLLTQLGSCCKPVPPDAIAGFVARGKGVSIHRVKCINFANMVARNPERMIEATWGERQDSVFSVGLVIEATDRQGLLRDISETLSREKVNVTAVNTLSRAGEARMSFTVELPGLAQLQHSLKLIREIPGVVDARRS